MKWNKIVNIFFILLILILFSFCIYFAFRCRENFENADIKLKEKEVDSYLKQLNEENFSESDAASIKNSLAVIEPRLVQEKTKLINLISSKESEIKDSELKVDKIINETNDQIKIIEDENMKKKKTIQEDANENINNMIQKNTDSSKRKVEKIHRSEQNLKTTLNTINTEIKSKKEEKQQLQLQKRDIKDELSKYIDFEPFTGMYVEGIANNKKEEDNKITLELIDQVNTLDNRISSLEISLSTLETRRTAIMKELSELQGSMNEQIVSIQQETQNKNSEIRQQLNSAKEINVENIEKSSESKINSLRFRMQDASKNHGITVKENTKHINDSNEKIIRINKILDNIKIIKNRNDDFLNNIERNKRDDKPANTLAEKREINSTKIDGIINSSAPQCFEVDGIQYCPT